MYTKKYDTALCIITKNVTEYTCYDAHFQTYILEDAAYFQNFRIFFEKFQIFVHAKSI